MSQKTNPSSLRISSKYKNFLSCWYSDYFYSEMISYDLQIRSYIEAVLDQSLHSQAVMRVQNDYKRCFISLFLLDARGIRQSREKALRLPLLSLQNSLQHTSKLDSFTPQRVPAERGNKRVNTLSRNEMSTNIAAKSLSLQNFSPKTQKDRAGISPQGVDTFLSIKSCLQASYNTLFSIHPEYSCSTSNITTPNFHSCLENRINSSHFDLAEFKFYPQLGLKGCDSKASTTNLRGSARTSVATVHPIRMIQDIQNAEFLAREIVYLLQKRAAFREIQSHILRQVIKSDIIKGIRISCSGRVGGRSKKAQKAKTQSVQWGESGLHVFSSKLDFASKSASTLFGKVGIKVWLCFK